MSTTTEGSDAPAPAEPLIVSLADLGVAPENLRASEPADADIPELADTLHAAGLIYPLLVRAGRKGERPFMALDGRRRLLAYETLVERGVCLADQPVRVEVLRDKASQAAAVIVANTQRAPVHVADVITAIGKMRSARFTTAKIAAALGYPELEVKRLQRLAGLPKAALEALRRGRINLRTAKLLAQVSDAGTLSTFTQQATAGYLSDYMITNHLHGRPGLDDPCFDLVGVARYRERGGRIEADLFGDFAEVILDFDLLRTLWKERTRVLAEALAERGLVAFEQDRELYRAPDGYEVASPNTVAGLTEEARSAWDVACAATDTAGQALATGDRSSDAADADLLAFLDARLEQERSLHGDRLSAVGVYPEAGTGFDIQAYLIPAVGGLDRTEEDDDEDGEGSVSDLPKRPAYRPEIVVPPQEVETEGRSHALHETYTDVATRGLIRGLADDPMTALTITVARMFTLLALQGPASTDQSASTLQGRRYSRGALPPAPALDGVVRSRLAVRRDAYLASGLRPIPWVSELPHGEKMAVLAELIAVSLDLREDGVGHIRRAARAEGAEIADLLGHDISAYWTPDADFLGRHTKAQLLDALEAMAADATPAKAMKKDELVGYVASVAAEKGWAPASLSLRQAEGAEIVFGDGTETKEGTIEDGGPDPADPHAAGAPTPAEPLPQAA